MARRAVILDRDGTICEEDGFLTDPERLRLIPGAAEAIVEINRAGFQSVVVTNQSAIARGLLDDARLADVHDRLRQLLAERGARLDGIYHCPHHPEHGPDRDCSCRKPRPGLLLRARAEMGIDLARSYIVGDRISDVEAAAAVGAIGILVRTGSGRGQLGEPERTPPAAGYVADDLLEAVRWIGNREAATGAGDIR